MVEDDWHHTAAFFQESRKRTRHDSGNLYDDLLLFDGEINRFLLSLIFWAHGMGTF